MIKFRVNKFRFLVSIFILLIIVSVATVMLKNSLSVKSYNRPAPVEAEVINSNDIKQENTPNPKNPDSNDTNAGKENTQTATNNPTENQTANTQPQQLTIQPVNPVNADSISAFVQSKTIVYSGNSSKMQIALTFDDGPDNNYTPRILDILKENKISATFFVIGRNAKANPNVLKRIANEGHAIGSHTYNHADLNKLTPDQVSTEMKDTEAVMDSVLGYHTAIMRPPYGLNSVQTVKTIANLGYRIIDWSVDTRDWSGIPPTQIMENIYKNLRPGAIILHHCAPGKMGLDNTISVLQGEINDLKAKGYKFVTVPELLNN